MTFSDPTAGGDTFEPKNHLGKLLIIYPKSYDPAMKTKASADPTAAADVDLVVVDETDAAGKPLFFSNARLFGNLAKSVRVLTERDGVTPKIYLGRLGQGVPTPGRTAPWIITPGTPEEKVQAASAHQMYEAGQLQSPENPMAQEAAPAAPRSWQPPASAPPAAPPAVDPNLVAFLQQRGVTVTPQMDQATCEAIARSFSQ